MRVSGAVAVVLGLCSLSAAAPKRTPKKAEAVRDIVKREVLEFFRGRPEVTVEIKCATKQRCLLTIAGTMDDVDEASGDLQGASELKRNIESMGFPAGQWLPDGRLEQPIQLTLSAVPRVACKASFEAYYARLDRDALKRCLKLSGAGEMQLAVATGKVPRRMSIDAAGDLVGTPAADCYLEILNREAARFEVPENVSDCTQPGWRVAGTPLPAPPSRPVPAPTVRPSDPVHARVWDRIAPFEKAYPKVQLGFTCDKLVCTLTAVGPRDGVDRLIAFVQSERSGIPDLVGQTSFHTPLGLATGKDSAVEVELELNKP